MYEFVSTWDRQDSGSTSVKMWLRKQLLAGALNSNNAKPISHECTSASCDSVRVYGRGCHMKFHVKGVKRTQMLHL